MAHAEGNPALPDEAASAVVARVRRRGALPATSCNATYHGEPAQPKFAQSLLDTSVRHSSQ